MTLTDDYESSLISGYGYDADTQTMSVRFRSNGREYNYAVPTETFTAFLASPSKGSYFHKYIKPHQIK